MLKDKVYEEQKRIFEDSLKDCNYQHLQEMKYLEKVIKESLRLFPTIQFVARKSKKDIELKSKFSLLWRLFNYKNYNLTSTLNKQKSYYLLVVRIKFFGCVAVPTNSWEVGVTQKAINKSTDQYLY